MDIAGLHGFKDQVTLQPDSENIAASLHPMIELNTNINMEKTPDGSFEKAMENLEIRSLSCDEKEKKSGENFSEESNDSALDGHVDRVESKANVKKFKRLKPPEIFRCEICLTEFENADMLKEHLDGHDFQYSCKTCGANFKLTLDFIDHVWKHGTDKLYKCPLCEFKVEKRNKMTLHLQTKHDQFKKYRCETCKKGINVYTHFLEHKFIHTEEKPFKCDKCDNSFALNVSLHSHNARMHIDDPVSCDVCQKICRNKIDLRSHKTCHYRKPVICKICGKTLSSKDKLRIHDRIHTGEKPYKCKFCPKSFKTSSFRSDHEKVHTGDKPHVCPICNKGFSQRTSMKVHETTHRTDKPFQCNICGKEFKSKIIFNGHVKKCGATSSFEPQVNEEVNYINGIGQNVLHEDVVNPEQYGTLTSQELQDLNHENVTEQRPLYQSYIYNPLMFNTSTIAQAQYPNMVTNPEPPNNYVQLEMWGDQNRTSEAIGNSAQTQQMNFQPGISLISLEQVLVSNEVFYGSTFQLPMQNTHQVLPSEIDDSQQNQQENR